jgi:hypothetical protein
MDSLGHRTGVSTHAARFSTLRRRVSNRLSHPEIWFQLAVGWDTKFVGLRDDKDPRKVVREA